MNNKHSYNTEWNGMTKGNCQVRDKIIVDLKTGRHLYYFNNGGHGWYGWVEGVASDRCDVTSALDLVRYTTPWAISYRKWRWEGLSIRSCLISKERIIDITTNQDLYHWSERDEKWNRITVISSPSLVKDTNSLIAWTMDDYKYDKLLAC